MNVRFTKVALSTLISASIGLSPLTVLAADPAPAPVESVPAVTPDAQPAKATKKAGAKSKKDKKADKKAKKKSKKKAKAAQEPVAAPQQ